MRLGASGSQGFLLLAGPQRVDISLALPACWPLSTCAAIRNWRTLKPLAFCKPFAVDVVAAGHLHFRRGGEGHAGGRARRGAPDAEVRMSVNDSRTAWDRLGLADRRLASQLVVAGLAGVANRRAPTINGLAGRLLAGQPWLGWLFVLNCGVAWVPPSPFSPSAFSHCLVAEPFLQRGPPGLHQRLRGRHGAVCVPPGPLRVGEGQCHAPGGG